MVKEIIRSKIDGQDNNSDYLFVKGSGACTKNHYYNRYHLPTEVNHVSDVMILIWIPAKQILSPPSSHLISNLLLQNRDIYGTMIGLETLRI